MNSTQYHADLFFRLFLLCMLISTAIFIIMLLLHQAGAMLMATTAFVCGLVLMLITYILLSLLGSALLSYLVTIAHQTLHGTFSLSAKLNRQWCNFQDKKATLATDYQNQFSYLQQKTRNRQQSLYDTNTKKHLRKLAKQTHKQLQKRRKAISPEVHKSTHQAIHRCVRQLDMYGLIEINFRLSITLDTISAACNETVPNGK